MESRNGMFCRICWFLWRDGSDAFYELNKSEEALSPGTSFGMDSGNTYSDIYCNNLSWLSLFPSEGILNATFVSEGISNDCLASEGIANILWSFLC